MIKDGINFLVAESDELYQETVDTVEIKIKDLVPGDIVILADKSKSTYLGYKYVAGADRFSPWDKDKKVYDVYYKPKHSDKAYHIFKPEWGGYDDIDLVGTVKILKKIGTSEVSSTGLYQIRKTGWGFQSKGYLFNTKKEAAEYDVESLIQMLKLLDGSK